MWDLCWYDVMWDDCLCCIVITIFNKNYLSFLFIFFFKSDSWEVKKSGSTMGSRGHTLMEVGPDGVAVITIVNPPVNSLSYDGTFWPFQFYFYCWISLYVVLLIFPSVSVSPFLSLVLRSLKQNFDQALGRNDVKAFVVTGIFYFKPLGRGNY